MNELLMSYINTEVDNRVAAIVSARVNEQVSAQVAVANAREEDRLTFEQRMKRSAQNLSAGGLSNDQIANALGFDKQTIDAWLADK